MSIMRVDSWELPLSANPLYQLLPCHLGPLRSTVSITCMSKAILTAPLELSTCPYQRSLLSFRMRSRSSMPNRASRSLDLVVTVSCGLTLQICLIITLSFHCRCWWFGFVNGQVSLVWSIALGTQELYTWPHLERGGRKRELVASPWTSFIFFLFLHKNMLWILIRSASLRHF